MNTNKDKYKAFCATRDDIPIFSEPWWLDAVCADGSWDVCLIEKKGELLGYLPFYLAKVKGFKVIRMPKLTPYLGVQIIYPAGLSPKKKMDLEQKLTSLLIEQLPQTSYTQIIHHPDFQNWLPFHWAGFRQTTMYTYRLNIKNTDLVFSNFRKNLKRNIAKAQEQLKCVETKDIQSFYDLILATFSRQDMDTPFTFEFFKNLDHQLSLQNRRIIFSTYDHSGKMVAAGYYVWDNHTAYYLLGGHLGHREAMSWTMWHAIQHFSNKVQVLDFEGSMLKNIAHFFSGFGAQPIPYHHTYKGKNKLVDVLKILKS